MPRGIVTYVGSIALSLAASGGSYAQPWLEDGLDLLLLEARDGPAIPHRIGVAADRCLRHRDL